MKLILLSLFMLAGVNAWCAVPEFVRVFATSERTMFALAKSDPVESKWLTMGQRFDGYELSSYSPDSRVLILKKDGQLFEQRLRHAKVDEGYFSVAGKVGFGVGGSLSVVEATLIPGVESALPISEGVVLKLTVSKQQDGTLRYDSKFEVKDASGKVKALGGPAVIARPGQVFSMKVGEHEYEFTPKKA